MSPAFLLSALAVRLERSTWAYTDTSPAPKPSGTSKASSAVSVYVRIACETYTNFVPTPSAASRHIPGVRFAGLIHPGIIGCAPSADVLATWNKREGELISTHTHLNRTVAEPPQPKSVHAGSATGELKEKIGKEGARTIPGRPEHGGNCDIKNLSRGSKVFLPVHVPGAKFSVGDLHFSQGDGEISFCGAIEMAGVITLKFSVMKDGMKSLDMKSPIYIPGPVEPQFGPGRYIYFEGFSVDEHGKQHYLDTTVAYRQTSLRVIEYLRRYGTLHKPLSRLDVWIC